MKLRFSLLALAIVLTGCPSPGPGTSADPEPRPSASPTPLDDPTGLAINTLGLIKAELQAVTFTHGKAWYEFNLGHFGILLEKAPENPLQPGDTRLRLREGGEEGQYIAVEALDEDPPQDYTHFLRPVPPAEIWQQLVITLGGQAAETRSLAASRMTVTFPAHARGDLVVTPPAYSLLRVMRTHWPETPSPNPYYTFESSQVIPRGDQDGMAFHDATASLTVAVSELDGQPSGGLTAANFALWTPMFRKDASTLQGQIRTVTETSPGRYRVVSTFERLDGPSATPRKLTLRVGNPTLQQEVTP